MVDADCIRSSNTFDSGASSNCVARRNIIRPLSFDISSSLIRTIFELRQHMVSGLRFRSNSSKRYLNITNITNAQLRKSEWEKLKLKLTSSHYVLRIFYYELYVPIHLQHVNDSNLNWIELNYFGKCEILF
ncbi:hypothetical protein BLOT_012723 [Blomia tropicalis]|nr:hypothetical protein BLOT_012723 [Blomia tropicalis]